MKINWWQVASITMLALAFGGLCISITVGAESMPWAIASMIGYGITRLEWVLQLITYAKESDDGEQEPDGYSP